MDMSRGDYEVILERSIQMLICQSFTISMVSLLLRSLAIGEVDADS